MTDRNAFADAIGRDPTCTCRVCRTYGAYAPGAEDYLGRLAREVGVGDRFAYQEAARILASAFFSLAGALLVRAHTMTDEAVQYPSSLDCHHAKAAFEREVVRARERFEKLIAVMEQVEGRG